MILNKNTKELFTDRGEFIKRMHCPFKKQWAELYKTESSLTRLCTECGKAVLDTQKFSDRELLNLINRNPETCLRVNSIQSNLTVIG